MCHALLGAVSVAGTRAMPCSALPLAHAVANDVRSTVNISGAVAVAATYFAGTAAFLQSIAGGFSVEPSTSSLNDAVTRHACNDAVSEAREPSVIPATGSRSVPPVRAVPAGRLSRFSDR